MTWDPNKLWHWHPTVRTGSDRTLGERAADRMKRMLATWTAIICFGALMGWWMVWNSWVHRGHHFDPYPWILLNLCLSSLAGIQCFVLLIANKRGEQISAAVAQHTYENTQAIQTLLKQNTELTRQNSDLTSRVAADTALLNEIHAHVEALCDQLKVNAGSIPAPVTKKGRQGVKAKAKPKSS